MEWLSVENVARDGNCPNYPIEISTTGFGTNALEHTGVSILAGNVIST
jgi:hypothetical protein